MKNVIAFTVAVLCHSVTKISAQPTSFIPKDTLVVLLEGANQVHLVYKEGKKLLKYERADSMKNLFIVDFQTSLEAAAIPEDTRVIHYLVAANGKRRLKAETDSAAEVFDLAEEKRRMSLNLPPYHYIIYDLAFDTEIHLYAERPEDLQLFSEANLNKALKATEKKNFNWHSSYTIRVKNGLVTPTELNRGSARIEFLTIPYLGAALIGNNISPVFGVDVCFRLYNKYGMKNLQLGYRPETFLFSVLAGDSIKNFKLGAFHTFYYLANAPGTGNRQFGFSFGFLGRVSEHPINSYLPKGSTKIGFLGYYGRLGYAVDVIVADATIWTVKEDTKRYLMGTLSIPIFGF